jgi:hypothetical protein
MKVIKRGGGEECGFLLTPSERTSTLKVMVAKYIAKSI